LLIYRLKFKAATLSVLWQTALIYVMNGMMREARNAASVEWQFYFQLCMAGLRDLAASFRAFGVVTHAILSMALQYSVVSLDEARDIAAELDILSRRHAQIEDDESRDGRSRWIIDLDLGVTDPFAAQGGSLADRFAGLLMIEEFTTGIYDDSSGDKDWVMNET